MYFYIGIKDPISNSTITDSRYIQLVEDNLNKGSNPSFRFKIKPNSLRTGIFPLYLWLGKDIRKQDYPFDIIDGIYSFNIVSREVSSVLGYNSINPNGTFNIRYTLSRDD